MSLESGVKREAAPQASLLETRLAKRLDREKRPIPIEIRMAFGAHDGPDDVDKFQGEIEQADVILAEYVGWTKDEEASYNKVAQGEAHPDDVGKTGGYWKRFREIIHQSRKGIFFLDLPEGDPLLQEGNEITAAFSALYRSIHAREMSYGDAMAEYVRITEKFVALNEKREQYIVSSIDKKLAQAVKSNPVYKTKSPLKVLTMYGSMHDRLYSDMQSMHPSTVNLMEPDYSFTHDHEYRRNKRGGGDISPELIEKGFASFLLIDAVFRNCPKQFTRSQKNSVLREVIDSCTSEKLMETYTAISTKDHEALEMLIWPRLRSEIEKIEAQ